MKGFLRLSPSLLLVILGSSSLTTVTAQIPGGASSSTVGQTPPTGSSSLTTVTAQTPGGASSSTVGQTPPTGSSSLTTVTAQTPGGASSSTVGQTPPTGSSSQTSVTAQTPGGASSSTVGQTPPTGSSSQTSVTAQTPGGASSSTVGQTPPTGSSSQTSVTAQTPDGASSSTVTSSSSTGPSNPCNPNPCKGSASCVRLHENNYFCLCSEGYYYNTSSSSCMKGMTFPGEISMDVPQTDLDNKNSKNYQDLYKNVTEFFQKAFQNTDYGQTVILKVGTASPKSARSATPVSVSVVNLFGEDTTQDEESVSFLIDHAIKNDGGAVKSYLQQSLCDYYGCVNNSNRCQDGLQCACKPGLDRLNLQVPFCIAVTTCPESCNAADKKQCLKADNGVMKCVCMPGYQKANEKCEECPFGYSGMDCKDQFQLILTIVGTIAGALILILLIAFIVSMRSKNKRKNVEEQKLIEDDFHNVRLRQTGFSNFGADNSIFPKVRTGVRSQTPNPYANQGSMPRPDY